MPLLSPYQDVVGQSSMLSGVTLLFAMLLASLLEKRQLQLKAFERQKGWASAGRDLLNGVALAILFGGFWLVGFSGPDSLFWGVLMAALFSFLHEGERHSVLSYGSAVLLWLCFLKWGEVFQKGLSTFKSFLFEG